MLTEDKTVANTTTKTTVWDPGINAGSLIEGRVYKIDLTGSFSTANTSDQFTVTIELAGNSLGNVVNEMANTTNAPWAVEFKFTVREDGQNGTIQTHTRSSFDSRFLGKHDAPVSVDTTTATQLSVSIQWDTANAGSTATLSQAHLSQMS